MFSFFMYPSSYMSTSAISQSFFFLVLAKAIMFILLQYSQWTKYFHKHMPEMYCRYFNTFQIIFGVLSKEGIPLDQE